MTTETDELYNVWSFKHNCWVGQINTTGSVPVAIEYPRARKILERWRTPGKEPLIHIRELEGNQQPGEVVGYNIWVINPLGIGKALYPRWTNASGCQDKDGKPRPLTWNEAQRVWISVFGGKGDSLIQEIGPDFQPCDAYRYTGKVILADIDPIELPKPPVQAQKAEPAIDFATYCGFKKLPPKSWSVERDPYTGLPKVK